MLPEKEEEAEHVTRQATAYCIQDGELYWKRPNDVSLCCISRGQGKELLEIFSFHVYISVCVVFHNVCIQLLSKEKTIEVDFKTK